MSQPTYRLLCSLALGVACILPFARFAAADENVFAGQLSETLDEGANGTACADVTFKARQRHLASTDPAAMTVLRFWFEEWDEDMIEGGKGRYNEKWFPHGAKGIEGSKEVDRIIRERFMTIFEAATNEGSGHLVQGWDIRSNPYENLAFILLIDQFARNMFRGTERSYRHDHLALQAARINLQKCFYSFYFTGYQKLFVVYPFMHDEELNSQIISLLYLRRLNEDDDHQFEFLNAFEKGMEHFQIILMFGRFPHRNVRRGRPSTAQEETYLERYGEPGFIDGSKW
ncbi:DUF924 domain-containing protein [Synechococcus sp. RSCCF101]|uniref:DUF924 family protein n=1 Tax=Synechococcus sp. RSCCF101 TaxID=2511069 RepID=UPI001245F9BB|nr:DUF924 family protein [Synechococcus sp. RSCCF101]QEY31237.1 DUF924 domain-containing protein [Synechococcus sp. RSCCF101]